ncbi:solute carrier family 15 member 2-like [Homarus americanus]|uniref:solute carrier family 15 member 2-like n=1 Tax=Homarus americanus TaxID=6706 RepID=UPI001C48D89C|nr:solute carrier family 15 member 2-like [Homarus americanus]XP_042235459.1 solute carrier family 15 member 2-like [Homarus americanus]XP_042235460.1 solute carrier family 15 member 2-like [Homarus americanus]
MTSSNTLPYPRGAFFILVGYLLERFVYYGLFGGAVFYMQRMLGFTSSTAKTVKSVMEGLIYLAPIVGAILADTYLGKVRLVFFMCCGYTVGTMIYALSSVTPIMLSVSAAKFTGIFGLLVLGICAGLMKAVYSSLGADQFKVPEQREQQKRFFYAFYWMINAGAFMGQFMTAQLRDTVQCFNNDCYFLPYIILVVLMAISTAVFVVGRSRYTEAPPDTMLIRAVRCVGHAIRKSWDKDRKPVEHWLDRSQGKYEDQLLQDVKVTLRVLLLFCTYPLFWALFYQTSTGMIFQAKRLDGLLGSYRIPPEMSSAVNPLLILTLIPLFDLVIYPLCDRLGVLTKTTSRMIVGMCFSITAFIVYAMVNMSVEQTLILPQQARIHVYNTLPCQVTVEVPLAASGQLSLESGGQVALPTFDVKVGEQVAMQVEASCPAPDMTQVKVDTQGAHETTVVITSTGAFILPPTLEYIKDEDAETKLRVLAPENNLPNVTLKYDMLSEHFRLVDGKTEFKRLSPQEYKVMIGEDNVGDAPVYQDGVYDVVITDTKVYLFPMTAPANVHMMWLLPQYILITIGEVLFSVSGMDFAYSQAPMAMKSILQAANLFTVTVGLWLFAGLTSVSAATGAFQHRASHEAFLYAGLMAVNTIVFVMLVKRFYNLPKVDDKEREAISETPEREQPPQPASHDNPAFVDDHSV